VASSRSSISKRSRPWLANAMRPCGTRRLRGERSAGGRHHGTAHRDVADDGLVLTATVTTGDVVSTEIGIFDARAVVTTWLFTVGAAGAASRPS
jgi:hypothetical protein